MWEQTTDPNRLRDRPSVVVRRYEHDREPAVVQNLQRGASEAKSGDATTTASAHHDQSGAFTDARLGERGDRLCLDDERASRDARLAQRLCPASALFECARAPTGLVRLSDPVGWGS